MPQARATNQSAYEDFKNAVLLLLFAPLWKQALRAQTWIKRAALTLTVVASFSYTAVHTHGPAAADGPLQVLTETRAKALDQYANLFWNIELSLSAQLKIQTCEEVFRALPASAQAGLAKEAALDASAAAIPSAYYSPQFKGMTAAQIVLWRDPRLDRSKQWLNMLSKAETESATMEEAALPPPPAGTTLSRVRAVDAQAKAVADPLSIFSKDMALPGTIDALRHQMMREALYGRAITQAMAQAKGKEALWEKVLGDDYESYKRKADALPAMRPLPVDIGHPDDRVKPIERN